MTTDPRDDPGAGDPPADGPPTSDPYRVLGVGPGASTAEITRAFRRLARTRHPDVAGPSTEEEYRRIRDAYEQLTVRPGDPGHQDDPGRQDESGRPPGTRIPVRVRSAPPRRGRDVTARTRLTLAELITGTTRTLVLDPDAGFSGEVTVRIPAGVTPGARLRVPGQGALGRHGGPPGDLVLTVDLTADTDFTVHGRDLRTHLLISFPQATLGADIPLTLPGHGPIRVTVPPGTTPGTQLSVPGAGLPATDRHPAGDLLVEIALHVPTDLTPQARQAIADLEHLIPTEQGDATP